MHTVMYIPHHSPHWLRWTTRVCVTLNSVETFPRLLYLCFIRHECHTLNRSDKEMLHGKYLQWGNGCWLSPMINNKNILIFAELQMSITINNNNNYLSAHVGIQEFAKYDHVGCIYNIIVQKIIPLFHGIWIKNCICKHLSC